MLNPGFAPYSVNVFPAAPLVRTVPNHWYGRNVSSPSNDIIYTLEGGIVIGFDNMKYAVPEGHAVCIPKNTVYSCWSICDNPLTYIDFVFDATMDGENIFSKIHMDGRTPVIEIPKKKVLEIYDETKNFSLENVPQSLLVCSQIMQFLLHIGTVFLQREETVRLYGDVLHMIRNRISSEITLESMAALRGVDPGYFSKKFKETAGVSPQHFLSRQRLWHAASLLKETDVSPHQAAAEIGCSDVYYFKTLFKNFFGVAPEGFKKIFEEPRYLNRKR